MWLLLLSLFCIVYYIFIMKNTRNAHLPGPFNLPIIGALYILFSKEHFTVTYLKLAEKYGGIFRLKLASVDSVIVTDPVLLKKILLKNETINRPPLYTLERFAKNGGVVLSNDELWKAQRKFFLKTLRVVGISRNAPNRQNMINHLQKSITDLIKEIDQNQRISPLETFGVPVAFSLFFLLGGGAPSLDKKAWEEFFHDVDKEAKGLSTVGPLNFFPILRFLPKYSKMRNELDETLSRLDKFQADLINEGKRNYKKKENRNFFVEALLEENKKDDVNFSEVRLIRLHHDLYAAGSETTRTGLSWILYILVKYQDVQNKTREEILKILGADGAIEGEDLEKLHYTQAVISECGRFRTVAPLGMPHYTTHDIDVDGIKIEKNTVIIGSLCGIHMNRKYWKTPEEFNPERFLNEDGTYRRHEWFMPFQTGLRVCAGEDFARAALAVFLVEVLRNFELRKCDGEELSLEEDEDIGLICSPRRQDIIFKKIQKV